MGCDVHVQTNTRCRARNVPRLHALRPLRPAAAGRRRCSSTAPSCRRRRLPVAGVVVHPSVVLALAALLAPVLVVKGVGAAGPEV